MDLYDDIRIPTDAAWCWNRVCTEYATDDEVADTHTDSSEDEKRPSSNLVDEEEGCCTEDDE